MQCNIFRGDSCTNGSSIRRPTDEKRRKKQNRVREFIGLRGASSRLMLFTFICFFRSETAEDQEKKRGKNCPLVNDLTHFGYLRRSFSQIKKCMNRAARTHTKAKAARPVISFCRRWLPAEQHVSPLAGVGVSANHKIMNLISFFTGVEEFSCVFARHVEWLELSRRSAGRRIISVVFPFFRVARN